MLLCRNGFSNSTRRLLTRSLTLALAYPLITVAQDAGHVRGASQTSVPGPWQLYSTATGLDLGTYADFATCRQAAVLGPDMSCKPTTPVHLDTSTPPIVQPAVVTPPTMSSAFRIDASNLPKGSVGSAFDRLQYTSEVAPLSDIGQFRIPCAYSHMAFDDPIVYPGRPGAAHLHTFFGNTGTNAASTEQSIRDTGNSTCYGGTINRSAYWVPSMIDTATGKPIAPDFAVFYYKQGYTLAPSRVIQPMPAGLRMISGDPKSAAPGTPGTRFKCIGGPNNSNDQYGSAIPNCDAGAMLYQEIFFPQCWDGRNLDSPDHKSHMSFVNQVPGGYACPATHPVPLPQISFNIAYIVQIKDAPRTWRLSSDTYDTSLPGGYSSHGDWFNGWKKEISDVWNANCVQASRDCHAHLLGDGRMMY